MQSLSRSTVRLERGFVIVVIHIRRGYASVERRLCSRHRWQERGIGKRDDGCNAIHANLRVIQDSKNFVATEAVEYGQAARCREIGESRSKYGPNAPLDCI